MSLIRHGRRQTLQGSRRREKACTAPHDGSHHGALTCGAGVRSRATRLQRTRAWAHGRHGTAAQGTRSPCVKGAGNAAQKLTGGGEGTVRRTKTQTQPRAVRKGHAVRTAAERTDTDRRGKQTAAGTLTPSPGTGNAEKTSDRAKAKFPGTAPTGSRDRIEASTAPDIRRTHALVKSPITWHVLRLATSLRNVSGVESPTAGPLTLTEWSQDPSGKIFRKTLSILGTTHS